MDRRVTFNLKGDTEGEDKDKRKTELKKRGRQSKLDKTESTNDCETVSDSMDDSEMGIAKRTQSKTAPDSSDIPLKSFLKKKTQEF